MSDEMPMPELENDLLMSPSKYEFLRKLVQVVLPGLATLYFTVAQIWGLPNAEEVVGTVTAVALFGGLLLTLAKRSWDNSEAKFDGVFDVEPTTGQATMHLKDDPGVMTDQKSQLLLKVRPVAA